MKTIKALVWILAVSAGCSGTKKDETSPTSLTYNRYQTTGQSAHDMLSASVYDKLMIQFSYMPGYAPDAAAIDQLQTFLETYCNKPGGISIVQKQVSSAGKPVMTIDDVVKAEDASRTALTTGRTLALHVLITDGDYTDASVLGVAYFNTSLCLFGKTINSNSGGFGQASRTKLVATVLEHEFGHLMGLVDIGSHQQVNHMDAAHGNHCNNNNCLMYYAAETTDILGFLISGNVPAPDANCKNDLKANGGK